jgi:trans-aconitate methyltransferase
LFYGPLHYLLVREIVRALDACTPVATLVDLGCGSGASGTAWATAFGRPPETIGIDRHPWAAGEAAWTYARFGLRATVRRDDITRASIPKTRSAIVAAFTVNEIGDDARRATLLRRLLDRAARGDRVLVVEPLARFVAPWWEIWRDAFVAARGRADEWRFRVDLPPIVAKLDRAAGLDHRELTGRSLFIDARTLG